MQRIEIQNFGPITELDLEIKDFTVLIGPQASGKSTIAKTIFFFKSLNDDLVKYFIEGLEKNDFSKPFNNVYSKIIRQKYLDYFGASTHLNGLHLKYYYGEDIWISISLETNHKYITPAFSETLLRKVKKIIWEVKEYSNANAQRNLSLLTSKDLLQLDSEKRRFITYIKQKCNHVFQDDRELIFIPAGRSLLATLSEQLQFVNSRSLDFLMRTFLDKINLVRPIFNKSLNDIVKERKLLTQQDIDYGATKLAEELITKILKGKYQYDKDGEKIFYSESNSYVKLNFSSSGQQESLWILLLLFTIVLEQQNVFVVIEEPEAHLFPEAQKEISNLISLLSNVNKSQVFITTHSPYILASINNLMLADQVGKKHPEEVSRKINRRLWIERKKVFAALVQKGKVKDIIDNEINIIQQEEIDSVSRIINEEFDFLFQLDVQ